MQVKVGGDPSKQAYLDEITQIEKEIKQGMRRGTIILSSSDQQAELKQLALKVYKERHKKK
ncbi:hypothetical protein KW798_02120 [Candidatus Parcubacteria bacterium]|nr:hypothetical protein [Candidatus Parcubacteria bacterium]